MAGYRKTRRKPRKVCFEDDHPERDVERFCDCAWRDYLSLADSALAFASNSHGIKAVSIETSISHTKSLKEGDVITATATEENLSNKIGIYKVEIINQEGNTVALFKGTVYRTSKDWEV